MGDTERFDDDGRAPASPRTSQIDEAVEAPSSLAEELGPASAGTPQSQAAPRRSSLRPAPVSFRPSTRDPAQLRPAMVVHAGDVDPSAPRWELPEPAPSQPSQVPLDSSTRVEPFALADGASAEQPQTLPLSIPRAGNVPREAIANGEEQTSAEDESAIDQSGPSPNRPTVKTPSRKFNANRMAPGIGPLPAADDGDSKSFGRRMLLAGAFALLLVCGVVTTMASRSNDAAPNGDPSARTERVARASPAPEAITNEVPASAQTSIPLEAEAPTTPQPSNSDDGTAPADTTRVTLELTPPDARVLRRGVAYAGPPYVFDVPKGKRIAVEVARPGYVTRRVDIDDRKQLVSIGLLRETRPKSRIKAAEPHSPDRRD